MYQLRSLRRRLTPDQQRRRLARIARRSGMTASPMALAPIVVTKPRNLWGWREQMKLQNLQHHLSGAYSARFIRAKVNALREHLMKVAEAAKIERCRWRRTKDSDPCDGRLRRRKNYRGGSERFCAECGRVPA
jgi:hypothetical protein